MSHIIATMKKLGYAANGKGVCFGIAAMGAQAVIRNDLRSFCERVVRIHNLTDEKIASIIKERESKKVDDLYHFFDGVSIYQGGKSLPYDIKRAIYPLAQSCSNENKTVFKNATTSPQNPEEKFEFADIKRTLVCSMTKEKLGKFVGKLKNFLKDQPFSLMINSIKFNHTTQLGFDGRHWLTVNHDVMNVFEDKKTSISTLLSQVTPNYCQSEGDVLNLSIDILLSEKSNVDLSWINKFELTNSKINTLKKDTKSFIDFINECCHSNKHETIKSLSKHIDSTLINEMIKHKSSPLLCATVAGNIETVETLLEIFKKIPLTTDQYVKILAVGTDGVSTLSSAALGGYAEITKLLLEKIPLAYEQFAEADNFTPALYWAAQEGHPKIVRLLIESIQKSGLPIAQQMSLLQAKNNDGIDALFIAAHNGHEETVDILLEAIEELMLPVKEQLTLLEAKRISGVSALTVAAAKGNIEIIKKLLAAFDNLKLTTKQQLALFDNNSGNIPALTIAAENGYKKTIELLLEHFEKMQLTPVQHLEQLNIKNEKNATALYLAASEGHDKTIKELIHAVEQLPLTTDQRFAFYNTKNGQDNDTTTFFLSAFAGHTDIVKQLLETFSNKPLTTDQLMTLLSATYKNGTTALYAAVQEGHIDIVKAILEAIEKMPFTTDQRVALLKAENNQGTTALLLAAMKGNDNMLHALVQAIDNIPMTMEQRQALLEARDSDGEPRLSITREQ